MLVLIVLREAVVTLTNKSRQLTWLRQFLECTWEAIELAQDIIQDIGVCNVSQNLSIMRSNVIAVIGVAVNSIFVRALLLTLSSRDWDDSYSLC